jgi:hypothetical protein
MYLISNKTANRAILRPKVSSKFNINEILSFVVGQIKISMHQKVADLNVIL